MGRYEYYCPVTHEKQVQHIAPAAGNPHQEPPHFYSAGASVEAIDAYEAELEAKGLKPSHQRHPHQRKEASPA